MLLQLKENKKMENILEINTLQAPIVLIDEQLNPYKNKVLFPEKVKKAKEILKQSGLPNEALLNDKLNELNPIGALIKQTRLQRHLSEEDLAVLLGVEKSVIFKLENNDTTVSMATILQVFHVLDAELSFVVTLQR